MDSPAGARMHVFTVCYNKAKIFRKQGFETLSKPTPASYEVRTRGECVWVGRWVRTGWPRQDVGGVGGREGSLPAARRGWNVGTARGGRGTRSPGAGGGARTQQRESDGLVHSHAHSLAHFCTQIIAHRDSIRNNLVHFLIKYSSLSVFCDYSIIF